MCGYKSREDIYYKYPVAMFCGRKSTKAVLTMLLLLTLSHVRTVVYMVAMGTPMPAHTWLHLKD